MSQFGIKMLYLLIFVQEFEKGIVMFLKAKFCAKMKILKSRTTDAFFGCFGRNFEKQLICLKSTPSIL